MRNKSDTFANLMKVLCRTKKYIGKYVAVIKDSMVVAADKSQLEAYKKAKKAHPADQLSIYYVPTAKEALTALCNSRTLK
jgi:hypothetical protein